MNILVVVELEGFGSVEEHLPLPAAAGDDILFEFELTLVGKNAAELSRRLSKGELTLKVRASCSSIDDVDWETSFSKTLRVSDLRGDTEIPMLSAILCANDEPSSATAEEGALDTEWSEGETIALEGTPVGGSWSFSEVSRTS